MANRKRRTPPIPGRAMSSMRKAARGLGALAVFAVSGTVACIPAMPIPQGAAQVFSQENSCPVARVVVTPRPDLPVHVVANHDENGAVRRPPPDVARDPERLKMWEAKQDWAAIDAMGPPYQVDGCGKSLLYVCFHPGLGRGIPNPVTVGIFQSRDMDNLSAVTCGQVQLPTSGK
jgi:hypothetical protein